MELLINRRLARLGWKLLTLHYSSIICALKVQNRLTSTKNITDNETQKLLVSKSETVRISDHHKEYGRCGRAGDNPSSHGINDKSDNPNVTSETDDENDEHDTTWESRDTIKQLIYQHTELSNDHLTPELKLHLITANCSLWHSNGDKSPFVDPFWAFYWPGGQVLTRYILDKPASVCGRAVLDVGSGCGASAIACKLVGAQEVTANDIDNVALTAIRLNAIANKVSLNVDASNIIGQFDPRWEVVLLGDMLYDAEFGTAVFDWVKFLARRNVNIFIGDPGRFSMKAYSSIPGMRKIFERRLPKSCMLENNGLTHGQVWKYSIIDR